MNDGEILSGTGVRTPEGWTHTRSRLRLASFCLSSSFSKSQQLGVKPGEQALNVVVC
jgi:hypothetical protein